MFHRPLTPQIYCGDSEAHRLLHSETGPRVAATAEQVNAVDRLILASCWFFTTPDLHVQAARYIFARLAYLAIYLLAEQGIPSFGLLLHAGTNRRYGALVWRIMLYCQRSESTSTFQRSRCSRETTSYGADVQKDATAKSGSRCSGSRS